VDLQQIVSRNVDPLKSAVVTVASIHGGHAENVIPDSAKITGTVRTFDPELRKYVKKRIGQLCAGLEIQHEVKVTLDYAHGHDSLYNHVQETRDLKEETEAILTDQKVT